jgi:hypothetical protein
MEFCPPSTTDVSIRKYILWQNQFHYSRSSTTTLLVSLCNLSCLFCTSFITYSGKLVVGLANGHLFTILIFDALKGKIPSEAASSKRWCLHWLPCANHHNFNSINGNSSTYPTYVHCPCNNSVCACMHSGWKAFIFMPACLKTEVWQFISKSFWWWCWITRIHFLDFIQHPVLLPNHYISRNGSSSILKWNLHSWICGPQTEACLI